MLAYLGYVLFDVWYPGWRDEALWFTSNLPERLRHWWEARRYRHLAGRCLQCGYDLIHNTSGTCPECGTPIHRGRCIL